MLIVCFALLLVIVVVQVVWMKKEKYVNNIVPTNCAQSTTCDALFNAHFFSQSPSTLSQQYMNLFNTIPDKEKSVLRDMLAVNVNLGASDQCIYDKACFMSAGIKKDYTLTDVDCTNNGGKIYQFDENGEAGCRFDFDTSADVTKLFNFAHAADQKKNGKIYAEEKKLLDDNNKLRTQNADNTSNAAQFEATSSQIQSQNKTLQTNIDKLKANYQKVLGISSGIQGAVGELKNTYQENKDLINTIYWSTIRDAPLGKPVVVLGSYDMSPWYSTSFVNKDAKWIWNTPNADKAAFVSKKILFSRCYFNANDKPINASINAAVDNYGTVLISNAFEQMQKVGVVLAGGWTSYRGPNFQTYQVQVQPGLNIISILAYNGGTVPNPAGFIFSMKMENGTSLVSDEKWTWQEIED